MWGILGALVMRGALIAIGTALLTNFHWVIFVLGAFLVYTGIKMAVQKEISVHPENNPVVNLAKRFIPISNDYDGDKFVTRINGKKIFTPLLVVLIVVEVTDLMFAVDSIPAIFAITTDSFIVYTSNVFAILGLRALYFALSGILDMFHYLKYGLGLVLSFVGIANSVDVTGVAGVSNGGDGLSGSWGDFDGDGYDDIYVANRSSANVLYMNNGDGTFSNNTAASGTGSTLDGYG